MVLFFSILTIIGQAIIIILLFSPAIRKRINQKAILFSLIIALTATTGSLIFSEILKIEPCKLCWFQRIFMYPQVILLAIALFKKDINISSYSIALSVIGGLIAAYHYFLQISTSAAPLASCSTVGYSISCTETFAPIFGYITISLNGFDCLYNDNLIPYKL